MRMTASAMLLWFALTAVFCMDAEGREPVIDMHIHAAPADMNGPTVTGFCAPYLKHMPPYEGGLSVAEFWFDFFENPPCDDPYWSPESDEALMAETLRVLERRNIIAVASGSVERVTAWHRANPDRIIKATSFVSGDTLIADHEYRGYFERQGFRVMSEVAPQYLGMSPLDANLEPYWALAEELQVPIGFHMVDGIPGINQTFAPDHRVLVGNPKLLEEILVRHPRLRLFVMHYGSPWVDEMIAIMNVFPQVYIELGGIQWVYPLPYFYKQLREFLDAGFGKRIMFGSDQMVWPGLIDHSIDAVANAPFLSEEQKRDIFYNNAARFLRLTEDEMAKHRELGR